MTVAKLIRTVVAIVVIGALATFIWGSVQSKRCLAKVQKDSEEPTTVIEVPEDVREESVSDWEIVREPSGRTVKRAWYSLDDEGELAALGSDGHVAPEEVRQRLLDSIFECRGLDQERVPPHANDTSGCEEREAQEWPEEEPAPAAAEHQ